MIGLGSSGAKIMSLGATPAKAAYLGTEKVWEAEQSETGSGTIVYSFDESTRTLAIQQTSASGNDTYSYSPTPQTLNVTTTYEHTVPPA